MKKGLLAVLAAAGLSGCVYDEYGTGLSLGYASSYGGYGGYGYGGYGDYGYRRYGNYRDRDCISYDRYGRAYYSCNYGGYGGSYGPNYYTPRATVYYYPGYSYRRGYYYDRYHRRYEPHDLYRRHHRHHDRDDD